MCDLESLHSTGLELKYENVFGSRLDSKVNKSLSSILFVVETMPFNSNLQGVKNTTQVLRVAVTIVITTV